MFGTNGGMGNQCQHFLKHLTHKIAQKDTESYNSYRIAQDANLFQNFKIGTRLHERLTNAFSQKIEHSLNCKISIASAGIQSP